MLADAIAQMASRLKTLGATYQERQDWFGLLLEHSSDLILTLDAEWHIGFVSPSLPRFLGWPLEQMVRRPLAAFVHPEDADAVLAACGAIAARPSPAEPIAFRLLHVDGSWRSVEAIASPPRNWSGPSGWCSPPETSARGSGWSASWPRRSRWRCSAASPAGVAHDFDNLLTAIQGYTSLLLRDLRPGDPQREGLEEIRQSSERAAGLTRQILAFGRRHAAESGPVDVNQLVGNLVRLLPPIIGDDLALVTVLSPSVGMVRADPGHLEQVVMNLVVNARDAMPDGGRLTIATANEQITDFDARASPELPPGHYVMLTVRDTGTGIDPATLPSIFEPFFTTKERGTGPGTRTGDGVRHREAVRGPHRRGERAGPGHHGPGLPADGPRGVRRRRTGNAEHARTHGSSCWWRTRSRSGSSPRPRWRSRATGCSRPGTAGRR